MGIDIFGACIPFPIYYEDLDYKKNLIFGGKAVILTLCYLCLACEGNNKSESVDASQREYYLEKVDSIRIDRETDVRILDYHPGKKQFLAVDKISEEFLVLDSKGGILEKVHRRGEGPNEINTNLLAVSFNQEEGGYFAQSSLEQLRFNNAWEVEGRIKFASYSTIYFYSGPCKAVPYYQKPGHSSPYFFTNFFSGVGTHGGGESEADIAGNLIEQYNPNKKELEWVLPFDSERLPVFDVDENNKDKKPTAIYSLNRKEGRLYLTFDRSTEMGVYDLTNDFSLIEKSAFKHQSFYPSYNAKNIGLIDFGQDIFGLLYYEGLSEAAPLLQEENPIRKISLLATPICINSFSSWTTYSDVRKYHFLLSATHGQRFYPFQTVACCCVICTQETWNPITIRIPSMS